MTDPTRLFDAIFILLFLILGMNVGNLARDAKSETLKTSAQIIGLLIMVFGILFPWL